jgi:hypothetical protein
MGGFSGTGPMDQSFFASFFSKKEVFSLLFTALLA